MAVSFVELSLQTVSSSTVERACVFAYLFVFVTISYSAVVFLFGKTRHGVAQSTRGWFWFLPALHCAREYFGSRFRLCIMNGSLSSAKAGAEAVTVKGVKAQV